MTKLVAITILVCVVGSLARMCTRTNLEQTTFEKLPKDAQDRLNKRLDKDFEGGTKIYKYKVDLEKDDGQKKTFYPFFITPPQGSPIYLKVRGDIESDEDVRLTLDFTEDDFNRLYSSCTLQ
ncbi:hypothetical protein GCK32_008021 [Trichostrongylus colubriformis]|uniref:Uncharacterized protein n=1 Tax=Trichostrongylus colubriformis TaxID=6319 RepID=A0AAN8G2R3_TRICO